ncbi:MAG: DUF2958 domain-containing protein [Clostridia bacterium]|nr:DUF2958 domain-containing protein [Clostridia bacterium]
MKLLTKELEEIFAKYPLGSQEKLGGKAKVIAKFFNPVGVGTWLILEADKLENGDYEMYGYANLGDDEMAEFGYINLSELQNLKLPLGLTIERDLYMPKDIDITEAIERNGFEVPSYLYKTEEDKEQNIEI